MAMNLAVENIKTEVMDHHGIVAGACRELSIMERINSRIGSRDPRRKVQPGAAVVAMIINGLGFTNRRLYLTPQFYESKPVKELLGVNVTAEQLDDHALGKCLDEIVDYGPTKLFGEIAFEIVTERGLLDEKAHMDSTSFSLTGDYETNEQTAIEVKYGYSKDHRPDLKQVMLSLVCTGPADLPIWMEPQSGNSSDKESFHESIKLIRHFQTELKDQQEFLWIADSAFYVKEKLKNYSDLKWISRVPESIKESSDIVQQREEDFLWINSNDGYRYTEKESTYGGVKQRWLLIFSQQAYERESHTFEKNLESKRKAIEKECWHAGNQVYSCELDAQKSIQKLIKKQTLFKITGQVIPMEKYDGVGRPTPNAKKIVSGYKIDFKIENNEEEISSQLRAKGRFILATNDLDKETLPSDKILKNYKEQQSVERGFRFLKDPWFMVDSFFVKKVSRIMALMMIMTLCLFVYNFIQHKLRSALTENDDTVPNQKGKDIQNPTARWIFQLFEGISLVKFFDASGTCIKMIVSNLNHVRQKIIKLLGTVTNQIYGINIPQGVT